MSEITLSCDWEHGVARCCSIKNVSQRNYDWPGSRLRRLMAGMPAIRGFTHGCLAAQVDLGSNCSQS
jgi:hypothetical protein